MRRVIIKEFDKYAEDLSNFTAMFDYRLKTLCVKAEEVALLTVKMRVEGEMVDLDKYTVIAKKDDYNFMIFPNYDEDMPALQQGLMSAHPEFKQQIGSMKVDIVESDGSPSERDARYVLVTMPDVDDDRYDLLKDATKAMYEQCKSQMEEVNAKADVTFAELTVGEEQENINLIKKKRNELNIEWNGKRDDIYNAKLQQIEEAHEKWLSQRAENERKQKEDEDARGESVTYSMRMGKPEEDAN